MRIEDYESKHDVTDPRDIRAVLSKRYDDRNTFWLFHGDEEFPEMNILANGELAYVHFFPREGIRVSLQWAHCQTCDPERIWSFSFIIRVSQLKS